MSATARGLNLTRRRVTLVWLLMAAVGLVWANEETVVAVQVLGLAVVVAQTVRLVVHRVRGEAGRARGALLGLAAGAVLTVVATVVPVWT
ncbi:hypothetical protein SAMN04489860_0851 [Paraoerskovia marina]|uniref:Uncharacterized protein n=1 Tax=Paraoerskovia marina TaxID=545619 RepID=A0A1H1PN36_9CELL|nr:hypothetical protein [Paraoerskovia marina]SDS12467.1 hypothetical protein SAMN04489860_0851 [Paraoerskovia marina]